MVFDSIPDGSYRSRPYLSMTDMLSEDTSTDSGFPSPQDMQGWLEREIADIHKAAELRITEATRFVNAYARGVLSADDTAQRSYEYEHRWGEALPGGFRSQGMTDDEIVAAVDKTRDKQGLLDKHVVERRKKGGTNPLR